MHYLINFIRHYLSATFIDVLHSPFVFDLYQQCIRRQKNKPQVFNEIEKIRKGLKNNHQTLSYTDFGASAKTLDSVEKVEIAALAKRHLKPARIAQILYYIIHKYHYQNLLELGTSLGITTSYLASGASPTDATIHTIEGCQDVREVALSTFSKLSLNSKIMSHEGKFDEVLPDILAQISVLDFLFVDGNHSYEATLHYFQQCLPKANNNSVFIFDDIYWSKGMTRAWEEIKNHPQVTVSVDLFFIGLIFFRKEQEKQQFKLRVL